jgi:hypothetical protein
VGALRCIRPAIKSDLRRRRDAISVYIQNKKKRSSPSGPRVGDKWLVTSGLEAGDQLQWAKSRGTVDKLSIGSMAKYRLAS